MTQRYLLLALVLGFGLLTACGGGGGNSSPAQELPVIEEPEEPLDPNLVVVQAGQ